MKRALLIALVSFICAVPAQAHHYNRPVQYYEDRMEFRMAAWRLAHGESWVTPALNVHLMALALSAWDWQQRDFKPGMRIAEEPFEVWSLEFVPAAFSAGLLRTWRCFGRPFTPMMALRWLAKRQRFRVIMLEPLYFLIGVSVRKMHAHSGYFRGKGVCTVYYVGFAGH